MVLEVFSYLIHSMNVGRVSVGLSLLPVQSSSSSLLDAWKKKNKINYSPCGFCCAFLLPKTDFLFESNSRALVGRKCSLLISTSDTCCQILVEAEGYIWVRTASHKILTWMHDQRRRERTGKEYLFWLYMVGTYCFLGSCVCFSFSGFSSSPCSSLFSLRWRLWGWA